MADMTDTDGHGVVKDQATSAGGNIPLKSQNPTTGSVPAGCDATAAMSRAMGGTLATTTNGIVANKPAVVRRLANG